LTGQLCVLERQTISALPCRRRLHVGDCMATAPKDSAAA
jgi:hypothetical protein